MPEISKTPNFGGKFFRGATIFLETLPAEVYLQRTDGDLWPQGKGPKAPKILFFPSFSTIGTKQQISVGVWFGDFDPTFVRCVLPDTKLPIQLKRSPTIP